MVKISGCFAGDVAMPPAKGKRPKNRAGRVITRTNLTIIVFPLGTWGRGQHHERAIIRAGTGARHMPFFNAFDFIVVR
jgi:hypothetical protein